jgi:hypothetical protein
MQRIITSSKLVRTLLSSGCILAVLAASVDAFQLSCGPSPSCLNSNINIKNAAARTHSLSSLDRDNVNVAFLTSCPSSIRQTSKGLYGSGNDEDTEPEVDDEADTDTEGYYGEFEGDEIIISTQQIRILRKEADKRRVEKKLATFFTPKEETDGSSFSESTLTEINNLFQSNELVEVRGLSKENKKLVNLVVDVLSMELERHQQSATASEGPVEAIARMVVPIQTKGFATVFYCPLTDGIKLRSNYRPNAWTRKLKAIRDTRGQIILGEDGKSIKE